MESLSLYELNALVRRSLEQCLPDECWVQAELSDVRTNSTGHCYLEFVQKDPRSNSLIAKARGTIWANVFRLLKPYFEEATGQAFVAGIKVLVQVTVSFHELYGYSLTVQDIDPTYTLGDMARRRREILKQLEEEGGSPSIRNSGCPVCRNVLPSYPHRRRRAMVTSVISWKTTPGVSTFIRNCFLP